MVSAVLARLEDDTGATPAERDRTEGSVVAGNNHQVVWADGRTLLVPRAAPGDVAQRWPWAGDEVLDVDEVESPVGEAFFVHARTVAHDSCDVKSQYMARALTSVSTLV